MVSSASEVIDISLGSLYSGRRVLIVVKYLASSSVKPSLTHDRHSLMSQFSYSSVLGKDE